ncbi:hypothetical protein [Streptomyces sp. NBC_01361]|uniref:hypothetical protein n=1 Tax=Streptomyces sp. NBC_01361 TaxID=2903838 RepID=UPI002E31321A|nr:hypothetical protein [Streptomyces sp. NBC_01361]
MTNQSAPLYDTNAVQAIRVRTHELKRRLADGATATAAEVEQLISDALTLADDSDHWYQLADCFRESYRLVAGLSDDELNARIVMDEATKAHPRPCRFPDSPDCICTDDAPAQS